MKNPPRDADESYRATLETIRDAIGPNRYLLGCWVIPLEGVGLMNGSRVGADVLPNWDGFKFALRATMEYYFLHNVAWYDDPDVLVVRSPLPLEQARAWATLVGLSGQAVLTSDRLMDLSPERVELLRRVYPATDIRPLDLFKSDRNKSVWDLKINHLGRSYDVVGLFNFSEAAPKTTYVSWKDLGLPSDRPVHVFDFWNHEYLGAWEGGISVDLLPASCRVLTLMPERDQPQLISTSRHITQGWVDLDSLSFRAADQTYAGKSRVVRDDPYELDFVFPPAQNFIVNAATATLDGRVLPIRISNHQGWATVEFTSPRTAEVGWNVSFAPADSYSFPVREPQGLWIESVGLDGAKLGWNVQHQPAVAYQVWLNGKLLGATTTQSFALRGLDPAATYTAEVRTAWMNGQTSAKKAERQFTLTQILPEAQSLSELDPLRLTPGWRQPEINRTFDGGGLEIGGRHFAHGVGMPTNSEIEFGLNGVYRRLTGLIGIDDEFNNRDGGVEFSVLLDGNEVWHSGSMKKADGAKEFSIDLGTARRLTLKIKRAGEGGRIPADWADLQLRK